MKGPQSPTVTHLLERPLLCNNMLQHLNHRPDFYITSNKNSTNIHVDSALIYNQTYFGLGQEETEMNQITFKK